MGKLSYKAYIYGRREGADDLFMKTLICLQTQLAGHAFQLFLYIEPSV